MLLKGQGLTIERPPRTIGTLVGAGAAAVPLLLAIALVVKASGWPVSFPQFLAYLGVAVLVALSLTFAFWAYGCLSLRYTLDRSGITVGWAAVRHFIAIDSIQKFIPGRGEQQPAVQGLGWWGYHVGRGRVEGIGDVLFFSTHRSPEELVYVQTENVIYALSPHDPVRFIAEAQRFQAAAGSGKGERRSGVERDLVSGHPLWADRTTQALTTAAVLLNVLLWGFVFAVYPGLNNEITIEFPPIGDITTLQSRSELLKIPAAATAVLAINLVAGFAFEWRERAATYLLLSGAVFFQALFWVGAIIAVLNA